MNHDVLTSSRRPTMKRCSHEAHISKPPGVNEAMVTPTRSHSLLAVSGMNATRHWHARTAPDSSDARHTRPWQRLFVDKKHHVECNTPKNEPAPSTLTPSAALGLLEQPRASPDHTRSSPLVQEDSVSTAVNYTREGSESTGVESLA